MLKLLKILSIIKKVVTIIVRANKVRKELEALYAMRGQLCTVCKRKLEGGGESAGDSAFTSRSLLRY